MGRGSAAIERIRTDGRTNTIVQSTARYEDWLRERLKDFVEKDLEEKHEKMAAGPFPFLRATYWRWAETVYAICPELKKGPKTHGIGDIHLENFGVWRDHEGRLVWGVNDFDEAALMPYTLDLARLATSAVLATGSARLGPARICALILKGYENGLENPAPFVLDRDHAWLREQFAVDALERADFWSKIKKKRKRTADKPKPPPERLHEVLKHSMPAKKKDLLFWESSAGTGSLGRPRWVAYAEWRGAPVLREAKVLVPSAWTRSHDPANEEILCSALADGKYRASDPKYVVHKDIVVRRLSPNSRKLEIENHGDILLNARMLEAMGHELANIHLGSEHSPEPEKIADDLGQRSPIWLLDAVEPIAAAIVRDQQEYAQSWRQAQRTL